MNFFDKIYVINLKTSTERREMMESQFKKLNVTNYEIYNAIVATNLDIEYYKQRKLFAYPNNDFCKTSCSCGGNGHDLRPYQIAVHLSHYNIWKDIIKNKYKKCLILEDDCIFTEHINDLSNVLQNVPNDWKFLYLGNSQKINNYNSSDINNYYFKKVIKNVDECHIYAITDDCANILIEHIFPIRAAIDGYFGHFMVSNKILSDVYISTTMFALNGSQLNMIKSDVEI